MLEFARKVASSGKIRAFLRMNDEGSKGSVVEESERMPADRVTVIGSGLSPRRANETERGDTPPDEGSGSADSDLKRGTTDESSDHPQNGITQRAPSSLSGLNDALPPEAAKPEVGSVPGLSPGLPIEMPANPSGNGSSPGLATSGAMQFEPTEQTGEGTSEPQISAADPAPKTLTTVLNTCEIENGNRVNRGGATVVHACDSGREKTLNSAGIDLAIRNGESVAPRADGRSAGSTGAIQVVPQEGALDKQAGNCEGDLGEAANSDLLAVIGSGLSPVLPSETGESKALDRGPGTAHFHALPQEAAKPDVGNVPGLPPRVSIEMTTNPSGNGSGVGPDQKMGGHYSEDNASERIPGGPSEPHFSEGVAASWAQLGQAVQSEGRSDRQSSNADPVPKIPTTVSNASESGNGKRVCGDGCDLENKRHGAGGTSANEVGLEDLPKDITDALGLWSARLGPSGPSLNLLPVMLTIAGSVLPKGTVLLTDILAAPVNSSLNTGLLAEDQGRKIWLYSFGPLL